MGRSDSPWYPTMRLFRQRSPGDWPGVFAEVVAELRRVVAGETMLPCGVEFDAVESWRPPRTTPVT